MKDKSKYSSKDWETEKRIEKEVEKRLNEILIKIEIAMKQLKRG